MNKKTLIELYKNGIISHKPIVDLEMRNKIRQLLKTGYTKTAAIKKVAVDVGVSERTVYRACKG
jgi:AraC-like DNA-binding protein